MQRRRFLKLSGMALGGLAAAPILGRASDVASSGGILPGAPVRHILATLNRLLPLHPALQYGAVAEPDRLVRVLVQKTSRGADGNAIAAAVGARNIEEFAFVKTNLFELKLSSVLDLVKNLNVLYVSPDGPIQRNSIAATNLKTRYPAETNATQVWNSNAQGTLATGAGTTVAVVDTGVATHPDLPNLVQVNVNKTATGANDAHGHGTHVAGIVGGRSTDGTYIGMAPGARIVGVKIADDSGNATESDLLRGLQWCYDHRTTHALDVVTLSVNTGFAESYRWSRGRQRCSSSDTRRSSPIK